jgi:hypothetical protein
VNTQLRSMEVARLARLGADLSGFDADSGPERSAFCYDQGSERDYGLCHDGRARLGCGPLERHERDPLGERPLRRKGRGT